MTIKKILRTSGMVVLMVLVSLGLGLSVNALRNDTRTMDLWPPYLSPDQWRYISLSRAAMLHARRRPRVIFLDARPEAAFCQGHIAGALSLYPGRPGPVGGHRPAATFPDCKLPRQGTIVVYGRTRSRHLAALLAWRLVRRGHRRVVVMKARFVDWKNAGRPISRIQPRGGTWAGED
jgi:3-mercaptopyruvate sulfurtransferase SseA